jgi:hypothetical protein
MSALLFTVNVAKAETALEGSVESIRKLRMSKARKPLLRDLDVIVSPPIIKLKEKRLSEK